MLEILCQPIRSDHNKEVSPQSSILTHQLNGRFLIIAYRLRHTDCCIKRVDNSAWSDTDWEMKSHYAGHTGRGFRVRGLLWWQPLLGYTLVLKHCDSNMTHDMEREFLDLRDSLWARSMCCEHIALWHTPLYSQPLVQGLTVSTYLQQERKYCVVDEWIRDLYCCYQL